MRCKACEGIGFVQCPDCSGEGMDYGIRKCASCAGEGQEACTSCEGRGKISLIEKVKSII
ncbi:DnaJ-class molecular chaperone [Gracilibacillus halotolerans]|uniref:DnaJ-class molecular chaperone n=1 Tax=Gracilibacillus halotolerans TaxID=74386 RepID=A0A841RND8_9BACI|nr:hypothetical protein [Gracilibacillus halotolerans]MBB6512464.1 DnaJ-class molecular chaperone [Gracilibacillus halotolerans]